MILIMRSIPDVLFSAMDLLSTRDVRTLSALSGFLPDPFWSSQPVEYRSVEASSFLTRYGAILTILKCSWKGNFVLSIKSFAGSRKDYLNKVNNTYVRPDVE